MDRNIFERMDLQQICSFILFCEEKANIEKGTYNERLEAARKSLYETLKQTCKNESAYLNAVENMDEILMIYEEVYTEVGVKSGARMIFQLLHTDNFAGIENRLSIDA